jgi:O-succinylbenzoic acid--CoA ligase
MTVEEFLKEWQSESPTVLVHTSGSTGKPKPMLVEKRRMEASARITCDFLGLRKGDTALLCLSTDYIAGKMMVVRSLVRGLRLICVEPSGHPLAMSVSTQRGQSLCNPLCSSHEGQSPERIDFAAMVPMQVYNSLKDPVERERLMQIRHLIIGGGAVDESLAAELKDFPNAVWSTYGMTETLSHIALRRLSGDDATEWYTPFDGVTLSLTADHCLVIDAPAVHDGPLVTNDIAELRSPSSPNSSTTRHAPQFRILGRKDNVICSGGIKIQAEEVERLLHPLMRVPFLITRSRDERLGEAVVLLTEGSEDEARAVCERVLPRYWRPRHIVHVERLPRTATGKPLRRLYET